MGGDVSTDAGARRTRHTPDTTISQPWFSRTDQSHHISFTTDLCAWKIFGKNVNNYIFYQQKWIHALLRMNEFLQLQVVFTIRLGIYCVDQRD